MSNKVKRLYKTFIPSSYDVTFAIDDENQTFYGKVLVRGRKVGPPSARFTFHANNLTITSATVTKMTRNKTETISISRINHQKSLHEVRLHTEEKLFSGTYEITMNFKAKITDSMTGIYPCYFKTEDGPKKLYATQFESHHAREAFPCIDEPEAKAIFTLSLITPQDLVVLSNTPVANVYKIDTSQNPLEDAFAQLNVGLVSLTNFEPTPQMSTYLLAFVYGALHSKTAHTHSGIEVRTWATTAQPDESLEFALDVAVKSIEYFEKYFGVAYPLKKVDHVALPDFSSGAMENWGLITYRERVLLDYPEQTSQSTREYIALVIAHETSHQWFGNLVTMKWWDDLWLNESFANMMEYQCINSLFPSWEVWNQFVASEGLSALRRDASAGVQSVHVDVHHPDEISTLFDPSIVYAKGGRLLYMLKSYIGEKAFKEGLRLYFQKHAYGNTIGQDLWHALSQASQKDIGSFMDPWLKRSGFPIITVQKDTHGYTIEQSHFLEDATKIDTERTWPVPLFSDDTTIPEILSSHSVQVPCRTLPLLNTGSRGHYIVRYNVPSAIEIIAQQIENKSMPESDRLMHLNQSAMIGRAGLQSYVNTLELLEAYRKETSEPVWGVMSSIIGETRRFVESNPLLESSIKAYSSELSAIPLEGLGVTEKADESTSDKKLRGTLLALSLYGENEKYLKYAQEATQDYIENNIPLSSELRSLIWSAPIRAGDSSVARALLKIHDSSQNSELRGDICDALTSTKDPDQASFLLDRLKQPALIKTQDVDRWLVFLLRNRFTKDTTWKWMEKEWRWLESTFSNDKSYDNIPRYAASCVNTDEYKAKYYAFFVPKLGQYTLKRNIEIGLEEIENRIKWIKRDLSLVERYFKDR